MLNRVIVLASNKVKINNRKREEKHIDESVIKRIGLELINYEKSIKESEIRKAKDKFMDLYQQCEFAYKQLLVDYKINAKGMTADEMYKSRKSKKTNTFNPNNLKIFDEQYPKVMKYAKMSIDERVFSLKPMYKNINNKSCRELRNEITHSSSSIACHEVFERQEELYRMLNDFFAFFK